MKERNFIDTNKFHYGDGSYNLNIIGANFSIIGPKRNYFELDKTLHNMLGRDFHINHYCDFQDDLFGIAWRKIK